MWEGKGHFVRLIISDIFCADGKISAGFPFVNTWAIPFQLVYFHRLIQRVVRHLVAANITLHILFHIPDNLWIIFRLMKDTYTLSHISS